MENICRTCLKTPPELLSIHSEAALIHKLETIAPIVVEDDDNLPTTICEECIVDINRFYNFRAMIVDSYKELKERLLKMKEEKSSNKEMEEISRNIKRESVEEEINVEDVKLQGENMITLDEEKASASRNSVKERGAIPKFTQIEIIRRLLSNKKVPPKKKLLDEQFGMESIQIKVEPSTDTVQENNNENVMEGAASTTNSPNLTQIDIIRRLLRRCYKCTMCDEKFQSRLKLTNHKRTAHIKTTVCNLCGIVIRADNLRKHLAIHAAKPVKCDECGKTYKNFESLRGHELSHRGDRFICEICGRSFNAKNKYKSHLKFHANPESRKAYCKVCDKKVSDIKKHMRSHTGEKPYICTYCNKGLSSSNALKVHMRQHTNEKPFQCNYCAMAFTQKPSLQTHLKSKHNAIL